MDRISGPGRAVGPIPQGRETTYHDARRGTSPVGALLSEFMGGGLRRRARRRSSQVPVSIGVACVGHDVRDACLVGEGMRRRWTPGPPP